MVKLHVNGIARKVVVDDLLPVGTRGQLLSSYSANPNELWVPIVEKAYMKLHAGYDFPGSNSGIDMYALTGWVPEIVSIPKDWRRRGKGGGSGQHEVFDERRTWDRIKNGSRFNDCLITISTGEMAESEADALGLVPTHAYAVLDAREVTSQGRELRLLQVKNPWAHKPWKGAYSTADTARWTPALCRELNYDL